ncbi:MAG: 2-amino-4-hydroxy-6-hydroxymethyldihydropteridine diphosphokinase [Proteobacteria bacterium]|nr:2-amino-4-hydroxy-6-hydroxymethyldihydropteridine diphosphokinase [Pseudomonadota bacterium]MBT5064666.1 2-amino-4-hydroxy-6-hydroxymethyldihydropteridine diphosphokinase [Pseudomonadota bacterium]MBT6192831.1 2-amino-4-hydroxy-6-hydroxymethyldihydropteridine diphosphokinase [Pseudomonadota bacterium]MBT6465053.1 2-amino-4-hydroxy-6-hydroxymethyldihydropteridine diphosphokinase [Pseudomonadota bacterium]MBT6673608.1 2-amino-4-hydroxy-6-hydroxymethyldihydropteridine diphosphokinase [Pseudomon
MTKDVLAYIGLGSNLNDPVIQVTRALEALGTIEGTSILEASQFYTSPAMGGPVDQADYVNAVAALRTVLSPRNLLQQLQLLELSQGRKRGPRWGSRIIDLDILLYGDRIIDEKDFRVPHISLHQRAFVLIPLFEIAPDLIMPNHGKLSHLVDALDSDELELVRN